MSWHMSLFSIHDKRKYKAVRSQHKKRKHKIPNYRLTLLCPTHDSSLGQVHGRAKCQKNHTHLEISPHRLRCVVTSCYIAPPFPVPHPLPYRTMFLTPSHSPLALNTLLMTSDNTPPYTHHSTRFDTRKKTCKHTYKYMHTTNEKQWPLQLVPHRAELQKATQRTRRK